MAKKSKKQHKKGWKHPEKKTHGKTGEVRIKSLKELPAAILSKEAVLAEIKPIELEETPEPTSEEGLTLNVDADREAEEAILEPEYSWEEEIPDELEAGLAQEGLALEPEPEAFDANSFIADLLKKQNGA
jgi:hypothetical protein